MEFIKGDTKENNWVFYKSAIAISDVELDDKIILQYKKKLQYKTELLLIFLNNYYLKDNSSVWSKF